MKKYIYYGGKIFTIDEAQHYFHMKKLAIQKELIEKNIAKEFDNFEDLIEVGDLVRRYNTEDDYEYLWALEDIEKLCNLRNYKGEHEIIEIYKHVSKDFVRVCHKDNGSWVID